MIKNVLEYLEIQAKENPNKSAVEMQDGSKISFEDLLIRSKEIGSYLAKFGYKKQAIPVFSNQSINSLVLFFSVLYSGNYYVPIDVDTPKDRVDSILQNCRAQLTIGCPSEFNNYTLDIPYYSIENIGKEIDEPLLNAIRRHHTSGDPLYMVYTSGSTGVPKGVIKSHNSMINFSVVSLFRL